MAQTGVTGRRCSEVHVKYSELGSRVFCSYKLAENIDAQLKRMAQDLKDITEHLNTSRGPADASDPVNPNFIFYILVRDKGYLTAVPLCLSARGYSAACGSKLGRVLCFVFGLVLFVKPAL